MPRPGKLARLVAIAAVLVFAAGSAAATTTSTCSTEEAIKKLLVYSGTCQETYSQVVLAYSHTTRGWTAFECSCPAKDKALTFSEKPELVEVLVGNSAKISRAKHQMDPRIMLIETNPLLYSITQTEVTVSDTADLAALKSFLALLGSTISAFVHADQAFDFTLPGKDAYIGTPAESLGAPPQRYPRPSQEYDDFVERIRSFTEETEQAARVVANSLGGLQEKATLLEAKTDQLIEKQLSIQVGVQQLEYGETPPAGWDQLEADLLSSTNTVITELRSATEGIQANTPQCSSTIKLVKGAIDLVINPIPAANLVGATASYVEHLAQVESLKLRQVDGCSSTLDAAVVSIAQSLTKLQPTQVGVEPDIQEKLMAARSAAQLYTAVIAASHDARVKADKVLAAAPALVTTASQLAGFKKRYDALKAGAPDDCVFTHGLLEVRRSSQQWRWDKVYSEKATINRIDDPLLKPVVSARPANHQVAYQIHPKRHTRFSISFGLIYTDVLDPSWTAVTNPDDDTTKVIVRSDEDSKAGQPTLLLTLHPWEWHDYRFSPGLDIGVSYDSGKPGAYLGGSIGLTRYLRFGVGWTWHQVKELAGDQREFGYLADGTVDPASIVADADAIRSRDAFDDALYLSLVFNFSGIDLFKPKE